jgi:hypothetical protein
MSPPLFEPAAGAAGYSRPGTGVLCRASTRLSRAGMVCAAEKQGVVVSPIGALFLVRQRRLRDCARWVSAPTAPIAARLRELAAFSRGGYGDPPRNLRTCAVVLAQRAALVFTRILASQDRRLQPPSRREAAFSPGLLGRGRHGENPFLPHLSARFSGFPNVGADCGQRFNRPPRRTQTKREGRAAIVAPPRPERPRLSPALRGEGPWNGPDKVLSCACGRRRGEE